jgi:PAS domain S-box-containing protein
MLDLLIGEVDHGQLWGDDARTVEQQPIEMILLKQLASYLAEAIFLVDTEGTLLYYNEPAEALLGHRYEETGELPLEDWVALIAPTDSLGRPLAPEEMPLGMAARKRVPQQGRVWIKGRDGVSRQVATTAIPLDGQGGVPLGAMSIFWEVTRR